MITLFAMLIISNATLFVSFAPISDISEHFFGDTYGNKSYLNLLATVFFICYFPGSLIGIYLMQHFHLRYTMIAAGAFTTIGACVRYIAIAQQSSLGDNTTYGLVLMGQCIAAISYPILVNVPALMSAVWFPVSERDLATMAGALFNPIGNAVGQVLPVIFVSETENDPSEGNIAADLAGSPTIMIFYINFATYCETCSVLVRS